MSNDIATKNQTAMTVGDKLQAAMDSIGVSIEDIQIPRLHLMQNTSGQVGEGNAKLGDIFNLQTMEVLGGTDQPLEIIPLRMFKNIRVSDMTETPPKLKRFDPFTPKFAFDAVDTDGKPIKNDLVLHFYVLLARDMESSFPFPHLISFTRTSKKAGEQIASQMFSNLSLGAKGFSKTVSLGVTKAQKGKNYYAVVSAAKGRNLTDAELAKSEVALLVTQSRKDDSFTAHDPVQEDAVDRTPHIVGKEDDLDI